MFWCPLIPTACAHKHCLLHYLRKVVTALSTNVFCWWLMRLSSISLNETHSTRRIIHCASYLMTATSALQLTFAFGGSKPFCSDPTSSALDFVLLTAAPLFQEVSAVQTHLKPRWNFPVFRVCFSILTRWSDRSITSIRQLFGNHW